ncbi:MAG: hypothetical protein ACRETS_03820, partial [Steroidobacteraceae bacterium]
MNRTPLPVLLLMLVCVTPASFAADPAGAAPGPWKSLLQDHSAPDWRGWKAPGLPAGWHVAGGVLSKDGDVDDLVTA